jgi:hypothetical protein
VYVLASFGAVAVVVLVGLALVYVVGLVAAAISATVAGVSLSGLTDTSVFADGATVAARGAVGIVTEAAIGFTVATLARSQLAGIGFGIAAYFVGTFATIFLPEIVKYLPFQLAGSAIGGGGGFGGGQQLARVDPELAVVLLAVWLIGSLIVAAGFSERVEITG